MALALAIGFALGTGGGTAARAVGLEAYATPDRSTAERWLRETVAPPVAPGGATAAAAVVVAGGEILATGTYGWFDPVRRVPISDHDQFLIGSVTKTFVGVVIAELTLAGRFRSVDDPVNRYLVRHRLPDAWGAAVTLRELATHTAGLDAPGFGSALHDQDTVPTTGTYLARKWPAIVRPPGFKAVYSNFGPPILAAAAEDVTGERFDRVMDEWLLRPLGMRDTIFGYDPTGGPRLVYAGLQTAGGVVAAPRTINTPWMAPAGSIQTTAVHGPQRRDVHDGHAPAVLSPRLLALEQAPLAVNHAGLSPIGLGIFLDRWNDTPVLGHSGLIAGFRSTLAIVPSRDFGVFVVYAGGRDPYSAGPGDPARALETLLARVLGPARPDPVRVTTAPAELARYAGRYWLELRAHTTPEVLLDLDRVTDVSPAEGGGLWIGEPGHPVRCEEIAPGLFQAPAAEGRRPMLYALEPGRLLMNKMYAVRVAPYADPLLWRRIGLLGVGGLLLGLLALVLPGPGRIAAALAGGIGVLVTATLVWPIWHEVDLDTPLILGSSWRFEVGRWSAWAALALALALALRLRLRTAVRTPSGGSAGAGWIGRRGWRIHRAVVAAAALLFTAFAAWVHLL